MFDVNLGVLAAEFPQGTYPVIEALKALNEQKMGASQSYRLAKVIKKASDEVQSFVDTKIKMVKENGFEVKDEEEKMIGFQVHPEKMEFVTAELTKLAEVKVEFEGEKLKLEDLSAIELSPKEMGPLMWLVEG
jgi:hypothetical protein